VNTRPSHAALRRRAARHHPLRRWAAIGLVAGVLLVMTFVSHAAPAPAAGGRTPAGAAIDSPVVAAVGAESSSWYCTGGSGPSGPGNEFLYFSNTTANTVSGTITVVNDSGTGTSVPISVPAYRETGISATQVEGGTWLAARVDLDGGGVVVHEAVAGPTGWSEAPCATESSSTWYFPSGSTAQGSSQYLSLFNPAATPAVVNLTFATSSGTMAPPPFEGIVVQPNGVVVADVDGYVQNQDVVATTVSTTAGRVVAAQLVEFAGSGIQGLALQLGTPRAETTWDLPRSVDVTGGSTELSLYDPTGVPERVSVTARLASGPTAPILLAVPARSFTQLNLANETRIPANTDYQTIVTAQGPGIVVARTVLAASVAQPPQFGATTAIEPTAWQGATHWVLPAPGTDTLAPASYVAPFAVDLANPTGATVTAQVDVVTASGFQPLSGSQTTLAPHAAAVLEPSVVRSVVSDPMVVVATGPLVVDEDLVPAGAPGIVTFPGVPAG
jgi:hypothetical protein